MTPLEKYRKIRREVAKRKTSFLKDLGEELNLNEDVIRDIAARNLEEDYPDYITEEWVRVCEINKCKLIDG